MKFYTYWRSTAAYRVRVALKLKGLKAEESFIHLTRNGGDQFSKDYSRINPQALVPSLTLDDGRTITQSLAILEYLEETYPEPPLLPSDTYERAQIRAASQLIASDIHPINNLRVGQYLKASHGQDQEDVIRWMRHWMNIGLAAFQRMIAGDSEFCFPSGPSMADICLVAQLYNAHRWGADLNQLRRLLDIEQNCLAIDAFALSAPEEQQDSE